MRIVMQIIITKSTIFNHKMIAHIQLYALQTNLGQMMEMSKLTNQLINECG